MNTPDVHHLVIQLKQAVEETNKIMAALHAEKVAIKILFNDNVSVEPPYLKLWQAEQRINHLDDSEE